MKHSTSDPHARIRAHCRGTGWRPCALVVAVLTSLPLLAAAQLTPVVLDNDPAPDTGGDYSSLGVPVRNDSGEVAFTASISGGTTIGGVFVESPSESRAVALRGESAPGAGSATFLNFLSATINSDGDVVFQATLTGGTAASGIFLEDSAGLSAVALAGDPAPGTGGGSFVGPGPPAIDAAGTIAFNSTITGGIVGAGVFRVSSGVISPLVLTADPVPGVANSFFTGFGTPGISASGDIVFYASLLGPSSVNHGLFMHDGAALAAVVLVGDPAPDTGGGTYTQISANTPAVSAAGEVAFGSGFGGGALGGVGLFRVSTSGATQSAVAFSGELAPGGGGGTFTTFPDGAAINASGDVAFTAQLSSPAGGTGVFASRAGTLEAVAITGDVAPDSGGNFSSFGSRPSIDTAGAIAFSGRVNVGVANSGIWLLPEPAGALPLALGALLLVRIARSERSAS